MASLEQGRSLPKEKGLEPIFLELALPSLVDSGNLDLSTVIIPRMSA
jgi:hypothetical protein